MSSPLADFRFGRPQFYASLLLFALLVQGLVLIARTPTSRGEAMHVLRGLAWWRNLPASASTSAARTEPSDIVATALPVLIFGRTAQPTWVWKWAARLPFLGFALWLGGGIWWVARRLYGDAGGYVALALYCFSAPVLRDAATVSPELIATWGLFGALWTAIGVAHTLYAPPRRWLPRIVLLGIGFGASLAAAPALIFVVPLGLVFMLYLAPGRRLASLGIVLVAYGLAILLSWAGTGFTWVPAVWAAGNVQELVPRFLDGNSFRAFFWSRAAIAVTELLAISLVTWMAWRRARYFGNTAPLLCGVFFFLLQGYAGLWAVPFLFVFIGGIFADLLETKHRPLAALVTVLLVVQHVLFTWSAVGRVPGS